MSATIAIVDDSLTVRMDLSEALERAGYRAVQCATLAAARVALAEQPIALVVLDVILPDGDGTALLAQIRSDPKLERTPVLMLSSEADVVDRLRGLRTGADEYVGKPYDIEYVVARVGELVRDRQAARSSVRVLVIDDSPTYRGALSAALEEAGYEVLSAESGEEGLRVAVVSRPDAILVDSMLPAMSGPDVIRRLRLDTALRGTPCLLLTAHDAPGAELSALDAGADAFARKDEDLGVILARLATLLRNARTLGNKTEGSSMLGPKKILAVDDSATYLHELAAALQGEGYDVVQARSGEEALELLAASPVDCILLDVMMPGLDGKETCRRIKATPAVRDIPLMLLTALDDGEAMIDGLSAGADDYISKSSDFDVLRARVRAQLRRKQFEDEHRRIRDELLRKELEAAEARAARDLAEAKAALVEELARKNRELETFSYSVSHDLRAPLRAIDGFGQALLEDCGHLIDEAGKKHLGRMRAAAQRMGELIDDLLSLSNVSRGTLERQQLDLSQLAQSVFDELLQREPARTVRVSIAAGMSAFADKKLVRIALENLVGNAMKFTAKRPDAQIEVGVLAQSPAVFFVRDNGAGFNMGYADKLFRPFQRLHAESDFPGTGIGLATVARIVDRHSGRVWAEGATAEGASFYFTLEREDPLENPSP